MLPQTQPPPPIFFYSGRSSAKFFAGEHFLEHFSRAHPHKYSCPSFIFILPPHHHTRGVRQDGNFFLASFFKEKIFVSSPRKLHINPPYQSQILNHLLIHRRKNLNYIHMELYNHYI